jgi:SAM-dependent methyltransferase
LKIDINQGFKSFPISLLKFFKFPKHAFEIRRRHAPPIPELTLDELRELRRVFDINKYSSDPSSDDGTGPAILKMLFARGLTVTTEQAERVFPKPSLDLLVQSGLLALENGQVKSLFQSQPYQDLIFFSDFFQWEDATDFVLPIGPAGHYLANLTIRKKAGSTLDLGCGCGIQSLLAARHSERVTATDINPRAIALTRLNAELNGIKNIETMEGSYFEPIENRNFDLIVANLPYVITPKNRLVYRDVDQPGDLSLRRWLKEIPGHLTEGGFAQVLINWVHRKNEDWWQPIRKTLADSHSDTWLIYTSSKQPGEYADIWIDRQTHSDPEEFKKTKQAWLNWYKSNHIPQIALGAVVLRHRTVTNNWFRFVQAKKNLEDSASGQFLHMFAVQDFLTSLENPETLLDKTFIPLDLEISPVHPGEKLLIIQSKGLRLEADVHPATLATLHHLDGHTCLRAAIQTISAQPDFSKEDVEGIVLADIKIFLQYGMIVIQTGD